MSQINLISSKNLHLYQQSSNFKKSYHYCLDIDSKHPCRTHLDVLIYRGSMDDSFDIKSFIFASTIPISVSCPMLWSSAPSTFTDWKLKFICNTNICFGMLQKGKEKKHMLFWSVLFNSLQKVSIRTSTVNQHDTFIIINFIVTLYEAISYTVYLQGMTLHA